MPTNQVKREQAIQCSLNGIIATKTNVDIVSNSWMANVEVNTQEVVSYVNQLPEYSAANWPTGQIIFVEELFVPVVAGNSNWIGIDGRAIGATEKNTLLLLGRNDSGQLGDNSVICRSSPVTTAGGGSTWCKVEAGFYGQNTIGIKTDGTLWTWGFNSAGALGNNSTANVSSPVTTAGGGTNWCFISANGSRSFSAIKTDGTLWTWGYDGGSGQLGSGATSTNRSSPGTTAGGGTTWCQTNNGTAVKTDGTLWTWGYGGSGRLGNNSTTGRNSPVTTAGGGTTWCQSSGGYKSTAGIKTDGTLWTWGCNNYGQLGDGTRLSRSSPGTVIGTGAMWCQVSQGGNAGTGIKVDGTLWTWGASAYGSLGNNTGGGCRSSPGTTAGGGTTWCQASRETSRFGAAAAVKTDGTLWVWGQNRYGALYGITASSPTSILSQCVGWCHISVERGLTTGIKVECTICKTI